MQAKDLLVTGDVRVVGDIYSPSLDFTPALTSGTHIGTLKINGKTVGLFAPVGGGESSGGGTTLGELGISVSADNINQLANISGNVQSQLNGKAPSTHTHSYNDLTNKPSIPAAANNGTLTIQRNGTTVQTFSANQSGNVTANISVPTKYSDLTGLPTIPSVGNGTLTIQKNGSNVATFSANQSGAATANITVPTKVSELTNDSRYTTEGHTHNYAGSSSAGGAANSAAALTGGAYVVVSSSEPSNSNCMIWVKTV
jgi:hypothetical protein